MFNKYAVGLTGASLLFSLAAHEIAAPLKTQALFPGMENLDVGQPVPPQGTQFFARNGGVFSALPTASLPQDIALKDHAALTCQRDARQLAIENWLIDQGAGYGAVVLRSAKEASRAPTGAILSWDGYHPVITTPDLRAAIDDHLMMACRPERDAGASIALIAQILNARP